MLWKTVLPYGTTRFMPHQADESSTMSNDELIEGKDYYRDGAFIVFTWYFHLKRGSCCGSGCRHCPYLPRHARGSTTVDDKKNISTPP